MGFRKAPGDPFDNLTGGHVPHSRAAGRPASPAIEESDFPAINVIETPAEIVVEAELPGVDPADIAVLAGDGLLVIEGDKREPPRPGRVNFLCMERAFGAFRRVVLTGGAVDVSRAVAVCRDGMLRVRVPKIEEKRGRVRVIPVSAEPSAERSDP